jgi:hypothetical protein
MWGEWNIVDKRMVLSDFLKKLLVIKNVISRERIEAGKSVVIAIFQVT